MGSERAAILPTRVVKPRSRSLADVTVLRPKTLAGRPGAIGGQPALAEPVPFVRPALPALEGVSRRLAASYERGILTNGPLVRELEEAAAERLGTAHVVAVSSCTSALMLVLRAFGLERPVIVPSFTFVATAQAATWNDLDPLFVDCDERSLQISPESVAASIGDASAVVATHMFGAPGPVEALERLTSEHGIPLLFDAAHGFGALRRGRPVGSFGSAEIFSLSPTKTLVAGEGGLVATNDASLASEISDGRNYGDSGDYDPRALGLNARMSEMHAALALEGLTLFDENLARRRRVAGWYRSALRDVPGVSCQHIDEGDESAYKDFAILIDGDEFGMSRDALAAALNDDGIETRRYFSPPVHRQQFYRDWYPTNLPITDSVAGCVLNLPIYPSLGRPTVFAIVEALARIQAHASEVAWQLERSGSNGLRRLDGPMGTGGRGYL